MRRLALPALAAALAAACASSPKPCTETLCPEKVSGSYRASGWSGSVTVTADAPKPPVLSDTKIEILEGEAEFSHGKARLIAAAGAKFRLEVSTAAWATIHVSDGPVSLKAASADAPSAVPAGVPFLLPRAAPFPEDPAAIYSY